MAPFLAAGTEPPQTFVVCLAGASRVKKNLLPVLATASPSSLSRRPGRFPDKPITIVVPFGAGGLSAHRLEGSQVREAVGGARGVVAGDARTAPAGHKRFVEAEIGKWAPMIKAAGHYAD